MELEEAIEILNDYKNNKKQFMKETLDKAIETVLQVLEDIDKKIENLEKWNEFYKEETTKTRKVICQILCNIIDDSKLNTVNKETKDLLIILEKYIKENSIPKKKIEDRLQELLNKLASAGLDGFYDEVRDIKEDLLEDK